MRLSVRSSSGAVVALVVSLWLASVAFFAWIGALMFQFCLWSMFAKDVPWYGDALGGLVCSPVLFPVTVLCFIAQLCGFAVPFFG